MEYNIIYFSGSRQKSYLAAARRDKLSGGRQKSYVAAARRDKVSGGRQKSYEGQSKLLSVL